MQTFEFGGMPGHVSEQTLELEDRGGKTRMEIHVVFRSKAGLDKMAKTGMKEGMDGAGSARASLSGK